MDKITVYICNICKPQKYEYWPGKSCPTCPAKMNKRHTLKVATQKAAKAAGQAGPKKKE